MEADPAQIVMERKEELFEIPDDEPEMLHSILSKLPKPLDIEGWISRAIRLLNERPPEGLSTWRHVSRLSVLKTSRRTNPNAPTSLAAAEELFRKQCAELEYIKRRNDFLKALAKHKRSLVLTLSALVGISSIAFGLYARSHGGLEAFPGLTTLWRAVAAVRRLV